MTMTLNSQEAAASATAEPQKVETYKTAPNPSHQGPPETYSGESLVVVAYAFVWVAVFVFVVVAWRRTRGLEGRLDRLESALTKARSAPVPSTKRSGSED